MEILKGALVDTPIRAAVFDFDGTISTLRCGWENVMRPMMLELLSGRADGFDPSLIRLVDAYIDESTGIQTIHQMKWLAAEIQKRRAGMPDDPWYYKREYNRRLMETVEARIRDLELGKKSPEAFLIRGSVDFLKRLRARGVRICVASGTDHPDVLRESAALGVDKLFDRIAGAPVDREGCSKEQVLRELIEAEGLSGGELAVIGDGKVEIALGNAAGARTLGMATDETGRSSLNPVKYERLLHAEANAIAGDFTDPAIWSFLGL